MNYLAHALPFLDRPHFMVGTGVPDFLTVADRQTRVRTRHVQAFLATAAGEVAEIAGGIGQHLRDDARFHETKVFMVTSLELTTWARDHLQGDPGFRPSFLGHLLVEVLLDAALAVENPLLLEAYYQAFSLVSPALVEATVNAMAPRPTARLALLLGEFRQHRILWDYLEDAKLMVRLNQVMRRVGLLALPDSFAELLPAARRLVGERRGELLDGIPA